MIFYHFMCPRIFWGDEWKSGYDPETGMLSAPTRDLVPSNAQYDHDGLPAQWRIPVVWLTTSTETKPAEHPQILRLLLTVRLPSTDRRLCGYAKWWGREHFHLVPPQQLKKQVAHWWVYRGIIPASRMVDAKLIMGQRPWWEEFSASEAA